VIESAIDLEHHLRFEVGRRVDWLHVKHDAAEFSARLEGSYPKWGTVRRALVAAALLAIQTASFATLSGEALTVLLAGFAANSMGSFVKGFTPLRASVAGLLTTVIFTKPGITNSPFSFSSLYPTVAMFSMTALTSLFETALDSEIASINWDLVIFVIVFSLLKSSSLELIAGRNARSARPNPIDANGIFVHRAAVLATLDAEQIDTIIASAPERTRRRIDSTTGLHGLNGR
jgi:hypothetical protein